jgi:hypothetical protein
LGELLRGSVETGETCIGGKPREHDGNILKPGRGSDRTPVAALVSRGGGARARVANSVDAKTLEAAIHENVAKEGRIITDELPAHRKAARQFTGGHFRVNHEVGEYSRSGVNANTAGLLFALLTRGIYATFQGVSKRRLHRYSDESPFRWNNRNVTHGGSTAVAVRSGEGRPLIYA